MKSLHSYIREENSTPLNTIGMGDPVMNDAEGSESIPAAKCKKQTSRKKNKKNKPLEEE